MTLRKNSKSLLIKLFVDKGCLFNLKILPKLQKIKKILLLIKLFCLNYQFGL